MGKTVQDVTLTCQLEFLTDKLQIHYAVSNRGMEDVYLLDVFPAVDQAARKPIADFGGAYICWRENSIAYLLKGIPPLPADKTVVVRMVPLGTRLSPGEKIERKFEVPLPLREQSPYYPPLKPEEYEETKINTLLFGVQLLRSTVEGFGVEPAPHGPNLYRVWGKYTVGQAEKLQCEFKVEDITLLKRNDWFTRI